MIDQLLQVAACCSEQLRVPLSTWPALSIADSIQGSGAIHLAQCSVGLVQPLECVGLQLRHPNNNLSEIYVLWIGRQVQLPFCSLKNTMHVILGNGFKGLLYATSAICIADVQQE